MTRGVVEAVMGDEKEAEDTRQCLIRGRPIVGLKQMLEQTNQGDHVFEEGASNPLKVLMVHGIGTHNPGYGTRLSENLARALSLDMVVEEFKEFKLIHPEVPDTFIGVLRVSRFLSEEKKRDMIFFELTWDVIVEDEKEKIAFDNSSEYSFRRAGLNQTLKLFVNETVPDVIMYYGRFQQAIQLSVAQSLCWMMSSDWEGLPNETKAYCDRESPKFLSRSDDDMVFISHSLGSRITADALQSIAVYADSDERFKDAARNLQEKELTFFMLSNQLPLLQLGREDPEVTNQIDEICSDNGIKQDERLFQKTHIVAFSDPNDLFSYPIPPNYLRKYIDSRLCPILTNVSINIVEVIDLLGVSKVANPLTAHTEYDNDERVIGLIVNGIGNEDVDPLVEERCLWTETIPSHF
jgi:hypothetical protein